MREDVTRALAEWVVSTPAAAIPRDVRHEGQRTFVNWLACAIGGSGHETVTLALRAVEPMSGPRRATVFGRGIRLDGLHAALLNGISSHVLDYDDTHLKALIHPGSPVVSAAFAAAELREARGDDLLTALTIGVEVACRIALSVLPDHYDRGWHMTGTAGVFGAAAAAGRLLRLDEQQMNWALGIAATQSSGLREMFGTMCKSLNPGRAAQNGLMAALLAEAGFNSSEHAIEAPRGFANVLSTHHDHAEILGSLGSRWEVSSNTYKPFACGIVIHPAIDACLEFRDELHPSLDDLVSVSIEAHPLVLELTGKKEPTKGLEGKFSIYHAIACALLRGDASPTAFTDEAVNDPSLVALRRRVDVTSNPSIHEASVRMRIRLANGRLLEKYIERAVGSAEKPLNDRQLTRKADALMIPALGMSATDDLSHQAWRLDDIRSIRELGELAAAGSGGRSVA